MFYLQQYVIKCFVEVMGSALLQMYVSVMTLILDKIVQEVCFFSLK